MTWAALTSGGKETILSCQKAPESARTVEDLAGEGGEVENSALNAPFYPHPITYSSPEVFSKADRHELLLGGSA